MGVARRGREGEERMFELRLEGLTVSEADG